MRTEFGGEVAFLLNEGDYGEEPVISHGANIIHNLVGRAMTIYQW